MNRTIFSVGALFFGMVGAAFFASSFFSAGGLYPVSSASLQATGSAAPVFSWARTWGGNAADSVNAVAVDSAGNLYVVGQFVGAVDFDPDPAIAYPLASNNDSIDAFLSKFDSSGNLLWAKAWGGIARDTAYGVGVDDSDNAYVVGPYRETVDFNPDPVITATHTSNYPSENNIYLSKFSPDGTFQWVRAWGPAPVPGRASFGAEGYTVAVDGNYLYVVGDFSGDETDFNPWDPSNPDPHQNHVPAEGIIFFDSFISKFDLNGNHIWAKTWGGEGYDDGPGIAVDAWGNLYVAGMYASQDINFDPDGGSGGLGHPAHDSGIIVDVFLSKFNSSGDFQWVKTWGGQGTEDATGLVKADETNSIYVAGRFVSMDCDFDPDPLITQTFSTNGGQDVFLSKFSPDGTFQWAKTWGGSGDDQPMGLAIDELDRIYIAGWFFDTVDFDPGTQTNNHVSNGLHDAFISLLDVNGNFDWVRTWGGGGDDTSSVVLDGVDTIYAQGKFAGTVDFDPGNGDYLTSNGQSDAFLLKLLPDIPVGTPTPTATVTPAPLNERLYLPLVKR